ncbi:MAG: flavodoxin [Nanoarchaeota archaeon]|nr:NAD(P)H-dependent oxidoreductase [Nanoarchaeota archaeon]MBU1850264.1 NAD(P)H-dependent oxidoreductase [Nanoarchaeota archaeon]
MKAIVVYYSKTGVTKKIANEIARNMNCDVEEITDDIKRSGFLGYFRCGREAMKKIVPRINSLKKNISSYDLVIIGTPVWGWNISSPVRGFLHHYKNSFSNVAFFCTMGGSGDTQSFLELEKLSGKKPLATLALKTIDVKQNNFLDKVNKFISKLNS